MLHRRLIGELVRWLTCGLAATVLAAVPAGAQPNAATLRVSVRSDRDAVSGARVVVNDAESLSDRTGSVALTIAAGTAVITVTKDGYLPETATVDLAAGEQRDVSLDLRRLEEEVVVTAARTSTRLSDQPLRVEVIDREEIEEKAMMTPGNVAMLVSETSGYAFRQRGHRSARRT